jgi:hypothetical protein
MAMEVLNAKGSSLGDRIIVIVVDDLTLALESF